MSYRNLFIENSAKITVKNEQLIINTGQEHSVPIEDISCVLLESLQSSASTAALSQLSQNGTAVFFCDDKHIPCGVLLPFSQHSRTLKWMKLQMLQSKPVAKRLWQQVVRAKIENQARCMALLNIMGDERLHVLAKQVLSGDSGNCEATAAAYYFPRIFGKGFVRSQNDIRNSALNYGYAIMRGAVARAIAVYGFTPAIGINHCSELNNFNLADDLMEPLRPLVDLFVAVHIDDSHHTLTPNLKHELFNLLNCEIESNSEKHSTSYAIERMIQSFGNCLDDKTKQFVLPKLLPIKQHIYD